VVERGEAAADEDLVPAGTILVEEKDRFAGGADAGVEPGGLNLHEGGEAVDFGFVGNEFGEDSSKAECVFAEGGASPIVTGSGGVAFVEDEVDDLKDGGEAGGELDAAREFEGDFGFAEGAFGTDDALGDSGLGEEIGAGDLVGSEAAEEAEGEGDPGFRRENGMAGDEDEAEEVVADGVVDGGVDVVGGELVGAFELIAELLVFPVEELVAPEEVDGAIFGGGHEPSCWIVGDSGLGPALEGGNQGVLGEVFGEADVADYAGEGGDELCRLDTPDGIDGTLDGVGALGFEGHLNDDTTFAPGVASREA